MSQLSQVLVPLRARIARTLGKDSMNEENTKATLIEPVLRALGWDTEDVDEVVREHKTKRGDHPVDYALLVMRTPRLYVEAKPLGANLGDSKCASQIMGYAGVAGIEWIVLTNGDEWRIYNAHAAVRIEEKLFRSVRISDPGTFAEETLALLSKDQLQGNLIEALWKLQFVDRKVQAAVEGLFGAEPDGGLLNLIRKRCAGLTAKDIKASLGRMRAKFDLPPVVLPPTEPGPVAPPKPKKATGKKPPTETSGISQHDLIAAKVIKPPLAVERTYKGQVLKATITPDGRVVHGSESFDSLSAAGGSAMRAVLGGPKPPACNGWDFWRYRDEQGQLVPVDALRRAFLEARK